MTHYDEGNYARSIREESFLIRTLLDKIKGKVD